MKNYKGLFFEYVTDFLNIYLRKQCGKSENTIESYKDSLTVFRKFLLTEKNTSIQKFKMTDCTKELVLDFVDYLRKQNGQVSTINRHVSAIKSYLWYVSDIDLSYQSISLSVSHIPTFRLPKFEKECLDSETLTLIFKAPKNNRKGLRDRTILILLYETAIRVSELINIKMNDLFLDVKDPYLLIHGKGDKERVVALSSKMIEHLRLYISIYHSSEDCNYLFYNTIKGENGPLCMSTIETFIQKYADQVREEYPSMPEKVHPHMFRRSRATHLYQDGVNLEIVSRMLGHSTLETTKIYAKPSIEMLRKAIENENDNGTKPAWTDEDEIAKLFGLR